MIKYFKYSYCIPFESSKIFFIFVSHTNSSLKIKYLFKVGLFDSYKMNPTELQYFTDEMLL